MNDSPNSPSPPTPNGPPPPPLTEEEAEAVLSAVAEAKAGLLWAVQVFRREGALVVAKLGRV